MALKRNPLTGQPEEDGLPSDPSAIPAIEPPATDLFAGGGGAAPAPPPAPVPPMGPTFTVLPPQPTHRTTVSTERRKPGAEVLAARRDGVIASGLGGIATEQEGDLAKQEDAVKAQQADETEKALKAEQVALQTREAERKKLLSEFQAQRDAEIDEVAKTRVAAGKAHGDYWEGNKSGQILAAILAGVDRAASSFRGETGPTGVDRIIDGAISAHVKKRLGEFEAAKETQEAKETSREKYLAARDRAAAVAIDEARLELKMIDARAAKAFHALGPQRAGAAKARADAAQAQRDAELRMKAGQLYDDSTRYAQMDAEGGPGSPDGGSIDMRTVLDIDGKPIGLAPGTDKSSPEGVQSREMHSLVTPITRKLADIKKLVSKTGTKDRFPLIGPHTTNQQEIASALDSILPQITQFLGSGTPQEAEAKRKLQTLSVSPTQDKETAAKNIDGVIEYFRGAYQDKVRSLVPGAKAGGDEIQTRTLPNGEKVRVKRSAGGKWVEVD